MIQPQTCTTKLAALLIFIHCCSSVLFASSTSVIDETTCGTSKFCVQFPTGCSSSDSDCVFFTYSYRSSSDDFFMELSGGVGSGEEYSSVAMTLTPKMENADTYICTGVELLTGVMKDDDPIIDDEQPKEITNVVASTKDGVGVCNFTRKRSIIREVTNKFKQDFDLVQTPFYIIYAIGVMKEAKKVGYHHKQRGATNGKISFTSKALASGCGSDFGCFSSPDHCQPGAGECKFLSWVYNIDSNSFDFTIVGNSMSSESYQAFGFADTPSMKDVDLYYCTASKVTSSTISKLYDHPKDDEVSLTSLSNLHYGVFDGSLLCKFSRPSALFKTVSTGVKSFDLVSSNFYLQHSTGKVSSTGGITKHHNIQNYGASAALVNFTTHIHTQPDDNGNKFAMIKAHAIFMLLAWITCVNVASVVARHYKFVAPQTKWYGVNVWLQTHSVLMSCCVLFTVIGIIIIFIEAREYSKDAGAHAVIGLLVLCLCFINMCMGILRPGVYDNKRAYFTWIHRILGLVCRVLATAAIFLGFKLLASSADTSYQVMIAFVVNQVLIEVALELLPKLVVPCLSTITFCGQNQLDKDANARYGIFAYLVISNVTFLITLIAIVIQL